MKKKILLLSTCLLGALLFTSCGGNENNNPPIEKPGEDTDDPIGDEGEKPGEEETPKLDFTGVTFASATYTYDGNHHILNEVSGAPADTNITYTGRYEYVDVGTYTATALLQKDGYNDLTLNATLTIEKATMSGLSFESKSVTYDGVDHINDVQLVGALPEGSTSSVTVRNENGDVVTSAIEVGTYDYTCVVENKNYHSVTLEASLTIKTEKTAMPVFVDSSGTIYFANGLDNSYLYALSDDETKRIDFSSPKEFSKYEDTALFIAGMPFINTVKEVNSGSTNVLYTDSNIDDFVKKSDTVYYYSSNSLTASKSGIYKVDATNSNDEPIVIKIFEGKTDHLAIYGDYLYFTNGNDNNYIYRLNLTNNTTSLVLEEKVHELIIDSGRLYCTVNGLLNDYIGYINLSNIENGITKLTNAAGEFLTVHSGYLYYNYTDLFSFVDESNKGIWRIPVTGGSATQILENDGINGFDVESTSSIVYIDQTDLHLYRYNHISESKVDLLADFVIPEYTPMNLGGQTIAYGTKIYYLNMYNGKTLYCYDEVTKTNQQLTPNKVEDFYIYGNTLYFNQVTMLTNNDLYSVNLTTGGEATKISSNDVRNMVSDGTYIYATHYNFMGVSGGISRMKLDGSEYVKFSEVNGAKNLTLRDGKLYYINCGTAQDNGDIEYVSLADINSTTEDLAGTNLSKEIDNVKQFAFDGDNIFYAYNGIIENSLRRTDFTTLGEGTKIADSKTNINEFLLNGDYVYYFSYPSSSPSNAGFYKVRKDATEDGTQELLVSGRVNGVNTFYGSNLALSNGGYLYFLNYIPKLQLGDAHFYQINLSSNSVSKIA